MFEVCNKRGKIRFSTFLEIAGKIWLSRASFSLPHSNLHSINDIHIAFSVEIPQCVNAQYVIKPS